MVDTHLRIVDRLRCLDGTLGNDAGNREPIARSTLLPSDPDRDFRILHGRRPRDVFELHHSGPRQALGDPDGGSRFPVGRCSMDQFNRNASGRIGSARFDCVLAGLCSTALVDPSISRLFQSSHRALSRSRFFQCLLPLLGAGIPYRISRLVPGTLHGCHGASGISGETMAVARRRSPRRLSRCLGQGHNLGCRRRNRIIDFSLPRLAGAQNFVETRPCMCLGDSFASGSCENVVGCGGQYEGPECFCSGIANI